MAVLYDRDAVVGMGRISAYRVAYVTEIRLTIPRRAGLLGSPTWCSAVS